MEASSSRKPIFTQPANHAGRDMALDEPQTEFSFDLFKDLIGEVPSKNLLYSPYSVSSAMSMVLLGCNGKTKSELERTLRFHDPAQAHEKMAALQHALTSSNLQVANKLFIQKSFSVKEKFLNEIQLLYKSDLESKNFRDHPEASRKEINDWVSKETHGKIKDLMQEGSINDDTKLVIANAIFFKGKWVSQFKNTAKRNFHTISGKVVKVDMMTREGEYPLAVDHEGKVSMIDIPYEGTPMSMVILLPNNDIRRIENSLDAGTFLRMYKSLSKVEVFLVLPKFKLQFEKDLVQSFKNLGAKLLFSWHADLSGISDHSDALCINSVSHKAYIEVDEKGTDAAAATGGSVLDCVESVSRTEFICNKPFLFFIYHKTTRTILFAGRMLNPTE